MYFYALINYVGDCWQGFRASWIVL